MESPEKSIRSGFIWLGSSVVLVRVLDAAALAIVLLHITGEELGVVSLAVAFGKVVEAIATYAFRITSAIVQAEDFSETQKHSSMWYALGVGLVSAAVMAAAAPALSWFFDAEILTAYVLVLAPRSIFLPLWAVITAFLNRGLRFAEIAHIRTGSSFIAAAARIGVALTVGGAWAMVVSHLLQGFFVMVAAFWLSGYRMRRVFVWQEIRPLAVFGVPLTFADLARTLLQNVDYFLIGKLLGERALGIYRLAFELAVEVSIPIVQIVHRSTQPVLAKLKNDREAYVRTFLWFVRMVMLAFAPICAFIYWGAADILALITKGEMTSAIEALGVTRLLVFVCLGRVAFELLPVAFITSDRPGEVLRFELIALGLLTGTLTVTLGYWGESHGVSVAAYTWLALYPALLIVVSLRAQTLLGIPVVKLAQSLGVALVAIAAMWGLGAGVDALIPAGAGPLVHLTCLAVVVMLASFALYRVRGRLTQQSNRTKAPQP